MNSKAINFFCSTPHMYTEEIRIVQNGEMATTKLLLEQSSKLRDSLRWPPFFLIENECRFKSHLTFILPHTCYFKEI